MRVGTEWMIEAVGCRPAALADLGAVQRLIGAVVAELELKVVGTPQWHRFPPLNETAPGGVTGLLLLSESHLCVHTYPEHGIATFNLYCCRPRPDWPWQARLRDALGATEVTIRRCERGELAEAGR